MAKDIYKLISSFPSGEKYALIQQINKAAVSVASNIAEGTSSYGYQQLKKTFCEGVNMFRFLMQLHPISKGEQHPLDYYIVSISILLAGKEEQYHWDIQPNYEN